MLGVFAACTVAFVVAVAACDALGSANVFGNAWRSGGDSALRGTWNAASAALASRAMPLSGWQSSWMSTSSASSGGGSAFASTRLGRAAGALFVSGGGSAHDGLAARAPVLQWLGSAAGALNVTFMPRAAMASPTMTGSPCPGTLRTWTTGSAAHSSTAAR
jgi:hypothetical protein